MNKFYSLSIGLATATLLLTGCAPTGDTPSADPAPTVTVTATPEPAAAQPDYGFTFFEEAQMGSAWDQMSAQLHYPVGGIDECPWYGAVWNSELTSTYAFMDSTNMAVGTRFFYTNRLFAADGASFPRNAESVGVGSTQVQVIAAYPGAVVGTHNDLGAGGQWSHLCTGF